MPGKQLSEIAWACAALRLQPSTQLLSALASAAARKLPCMDPASLANLLWSLFLLDEGGPGPAWMDLWLSESAGKMSGFEAQDLALVASGLAAARYAPFSLLSSSPLPPSTLHACMQGRTLCSGLLPSAAPFIARC